MLRVGLVGAGGIGREHLKALLQVEGVRVVGVADASPIAAEELTRAIGVEAHTDYRALLDRVDAVWICTPPYLHAEQAVAFAESGVHVFCEKPIALDLGSADQIIAAARDGGVHLMVGQVIRYFPETIAIREMLSRGELGDPVFAFGRRLFSRSPASWAPWRRDVQLSGGFAVESGVHEVDTVRWLAGEVTSVYARVTYGHADYPTLDTDFRSLLKLASGISAGVDVGLQSAIREWSWGVVGTRATAVSSRRGQVRVVPTENGEEQVLDVGPVRDTESLLGQAMLAEDRAFVDAIHTDRIPPIPGEEGRRNLAIVLAALQSSIQERVIQLEAEGSGQ